MLLLLCYCVAIVMLKCVTFLLVTKRFIFLIRHLHHLLLRLLLMMLTGSGIISWLEANSRDIFNLSESRKQLLTHLTLFYFTSTSLPALYHSSPCKETETQRHLTGRYA